MSVVFTGIVAILRQYGTTLVGAPIGGFLTDKLKSPSKVLIGVDIIGIAGFCILLSLKGGVSAGFLIALTLLISAAVYIGRGSYYATLTEACVPRELSASTIGVAAAVGFSPDLFQFTLFGYWLDTYGNRAYHFMFIYQIVVLVIGIFAASLILRSAKKHAAFAAAQASK